MRFHLLSLGLISLTLAACAPSGTAGSGQLLDRSSFGDVYRVQDSALVPSLRYPNSTFAIRKSAELDDSIGDIYPKKAAYRCTRFEHVFWNDTLDYRTRMNDVEYSLKTLGYAVRKVGERDGVAWGLFIRPGASYTYRWEFGENITFLSFCKTERNPDAPDDVDDFASN